jgi:hypothetical protein
MHLPLLKKPVSRLRTTTLLSLASTLLVLIGSNGARALEAQSAPVGGMKLGSATPSIYHEGWIDLNKNGRKDVYEDPEQPIEKRIEDLLAQMTLEEKLAQARTAQFSEIAKAGVRLAANGNLGSVSDCQLTEQREALQRAAVEKSRLGVPLSFTQDAPQGAGEQIQPVGLRLSSPEEIFKSLDGSVRQVLRTKFLKGLFEKPYLRGKESCVAPDMAT